MARRLKAAPEPEPEPQPQPQLSSARNRIKPPPLSALRAAAADAVNSLENFTGTNIASFQLFQLTVVSFHLTISTS